LQQGVKGRCSQAKGVRGEELALQAQEGLHLCVYSIAVLFFFSPDLQPQLSTLLGQLQCVVRVSIQTRF
jgi:hypothetical protein